MRGKFVVFLSVVLVVVVATSVQAFDGKRKGFILGGGAGLGVTSFDQTLRVPGFQDATSDRESKLGLATEFKIGGGFNDQFLLYYVNRAAWFSIENIFSQDVTIANSVGLVGISYYFQPTSPSPYLVAVLGISSWDAPFEDTTAQVGVGLGAGLGYEFARHWSLEATINWGQPSDEDLGVEVETDALSVLLTISGLAY